MICTRNFISDVNQVPVVWVFSHYCHIPIERFDGSNFKINSVLTTKDKTPSMSFYMKDGVYRYNDFSTGLKGSHIDFIKDKLGLSYHDASTLLVSDYNNWIAEGGVYLHTDITQKDKFKVSSHTIRNWIVSDKDFWVPFNIGSKLLGRYYVKPLERYVMSRESEEFEVTGEHIYGYFTSLGELYKIYQPYSDHKFIKVSSYIQGSEQLLGHPFLLYLSSLKDVMSFASLNLRMDAKAPDSENTILSPQEVEKDKNQYKKILVLFDNDDAGQKAARRYRDEYDIPSVFLNYGQKDLSDHFKTFKATKVSRWLIPLIDKKLNT